MDENILDEHHIENTDLRRRDLLPFWIKIFVWTFLIFGAFVPVILILGILGKDCNLALYGLGTARPFSTIGISITFIFALKGLVAFGLWKEKEWAVNLAIADAIIGIIVCVYVAFILPFVTNGINISLRLELIPLIAYLIKMTKIKNEWLNRTELRKY